MPDVNNSSSNSDSVNSENPYYIGSSDNPSSVLISHPFNGTGFNSWKRSMIISLSTKNKLGFVDKTILEPESSSPDYAKWSRANSMVIGWILNSLSTSIADSALFLPTAHEIWSELHQRFEQPDGASIYQIQQQLYSTSQGSDDFATYFTKLTKIWDDLRLIQNFPSCSCAVATQIKKFLDEQRLVQLLMGLNDSYMMIRGQLLMMKPLPSVSTAYSMILHEERQRGIHSSSTFAPDAIAMNASKDPVSAQMKKTMVCTHFKKSGHTKNQCYRIIGFPATLKFTKSKKEDVKSTAHNVTDASSSSLSTEQYEHLVQLL